MEGRLALRPTGLFVQIAGVITGRQIHLRSAQVPCFHLPPSPPNPSPPTVPQAAAITDKYEFMVLPFVANINMEQGANEAATQLQAVINQQNAYGWEYVRLETVETFVRGDSGCLGIGSTEPRWEHFKMIVLRRKR